MSFFFQFTCPTSDELGEIGVTDKQILLFLAMDGYAVNGLFLLPFLLFLSFSLLFSVWARCRSGQSHVILYQHALELTVIRS